MIMAAIVTGRRNPRPRWDEGAAAVEAALVLPLLFLFIFAIIEFGRSLWQWNTMLLAVEQAGRWAMINNSDTNLVTDVETQMQAVLTDAAVCTTPTSGQMCVSASITTGTPSTLTLTAAYNFNPVAFFSPFTITSQGTVPLD
jgi:Flp pilus assembly protein TadG